MLTILNKYKTLDNVLGNLSDLNTSDKSSIVNAVNEIANGIIVAEESLDTSSSSLTVSGLDLESDGKYKIEFQGYANNNGEILIQLNNIVNNYNNLVISATGTNNTSSNNNIVSVWRPSVEYIGYGLAVDNSNAQFNLNMEVFKDELFNNTYYNIDYNGNQPYNHAITFIRGNVGLGTNINVTSIKFINSDGTFKAGTKVVVRKIS